MSVSRGGQRAQNTCYRIVRETHRWPFTYSIERKDGDRWWFVPQGSLSITLWGARRNLWRLLKNEGKEIIEEYRSGVA